MMRIVAFTSEVEALRSRYSIALSTSAGEKARYALGRNQLSAVIAPRAMVESVQTATLDALRCWSVTLLSAARWPAVGEPPSVTTSTRGPEPGEMWVAM